MMITTNSGRRREVFLKIVPLRIHGRDGKYVDTHACLDDCSQSTLIREDIVQKLDLTGETANVNVKTINDKKRTSVELVDFSISSMDKGFTTTIEMAQSTPSEKFNMPHRPALRNFCDMNKVNHLDGINVDAEYLDANDVTILIGADSPESVNL